MFQIKKYRGVMFDSSEDAKWEGKLTCNFKNDMRNLTNSHRMKNCDFIWKENKNSEQSD